MKHCVLAEHCWFFATYSLQSSETKPDLAPYAKVAESHCCLIFLKSFLFDCEFFFFAVFEKTRKKEKRRKNRLKKKCKKTHPALAGARLPAVDDVLNREVGHRERSGAAADVVAVGQGRGRGCFFFFFFLNI